MIWQRLTLHKAQKMEMVSLQQHKSVMKAHHSVAKSEDYPCFISKTIRSIPLTHLLSKPSNNKHHHPCTSHIPRSFLNILNGLRSHR